LAHDSTLSIGSFFVFSPEAVLEDESEEQEDSRGKSGSTNAEKWRLKFVSD